METHTHTHTKNDFFFLLLYDTIWEFLSFLVIICNETSKNIFLLFIFYFQRKKRRKKSFPIFPLLLNQRKKKSFKRKREKITKDIPVLRIEGRNDGIRYIMVSFAWVLFWFRYVLTRDNKTVEMFSLSLMLISCISLKQGGMIVWLRYENLN
jgi:hypothetical protein